MKTKVPQPIMVSVYYNFNKKCWSVAQSGLLLFHATGLWLSDCTFSVSQPGRERVLREGRKNVHARIYGYLRRPFGGKLKRITYNPYTHTEFMCEGQRIYYADRVFFDADGKSWCKHLTKRLK